jgi:predicted metal-dependent enzyme (double-stranded beta helix superfamily)
MLDIDAFIRACRAALRQADSGDRLAEVVRRAVRTPAEDEAVLGPMIEGGETVLHNAPDLTVVHVVWTPGMFLYPHDHGMMTAIGVYEGTEENLLFRRVAGGIDEVGRRRLGRGDVLVLGPDDIHAVLNPDERFAGAIHVFAGDSLRQPHSEWDPQTYEERPYDQEHTQHAFEAANASWRQSLQTGRSEPARGAGSGHPERSTRGP